MIRGGVVLAIPQDPAGRDESEEEVALELIH